MFDTSSKNKKKSSNRKSPTRSRRSSDREPKAHSGHRVTRDAAIGFFKTVKGISEGSGLLMPLRETCGIIVYMLEITRSMSKNKEDQKGIREQLISHLHTITNQIKTLEEDARAEGREPKLNPAISGPLKTYVGKLLELFDSLDRVRSKNLLERILAARIDQDSLKNLNSDIEAAFRLYSISLQTFVAVKINYIQSELSRLNARFEQHLRQTEIRGLGASTVEGDQHAKLFLSGTRTKTIQDVCRWVEQAERAVWMYCLLDVAGSGKSTVTRHLVEKWMDEGRLVARFFFSRNSDELRSTKLFASAISDQYTKQSQDFKDCLSRCRIPLDPSIEHTFKALVVEPLRALDKPAILVIDALDECDNSPQSRARSRLLELLKSQQQSLQKLRIFATGRPEIDIKESLEELSARITNFRELEGSNDPDVDRYIQWRLSNHKKQDQVRRIVELADSHFIWARIACDLFCYSLDQDSLITKLERAVLGDDRLKDLYQVALTQSLPKDSDSQQAAGFLLQIIFAAQKPLSISDLEALSPYPSVVERTVNALGSLLIHDGRDGPIRPLHLTFREFVTGKTMGTEPFIQLEFGHRTLVSACIRKLDEFRYIYNVSELDTSLKRISSYAFSFWPYHYADSYGKLDLDDGILRFISDRLSDCIRLMNLQDGYVAFTGNVLVLAKRNPLSQLTQSLVKKTISEITNKVTTDIRIFTSTVDGMADIGPL